MGCTWCWNDYHCERRRLEREAAEAEARALAALPLPCDCTAGRLEKDMIVGAHIMRHWVCLCPKERRWTTRHDAGDQAQPVQPLETFERRYPIGGR